MFITNIRFLFFRSILESLPVATENNDCFALEKKCHQVRLALEYATTCIVNLPSRKNINLFFLEVLYMFGNFVFSAKYCLFIAV